MKYMNKNYKKISLHHIYAVIEPDTKVVYVGKTTITNPYKKRANIINGGVSAIDGEFSEDSKFILLESVFISKPDAFRHILAWYLFFKNYGYKVLVSNNADYMLKFPKEKTMNIYIEFCSPYSINEVLERKVFPLKKQEEKEDFQDEPIPFTQFNIRVRKIVADLFRTVSQSLGLSQNDTLKLLMMEKEDEMKISIANEICSLREKKQKLEEELKQQRKRYKEDKIRALEKQRELINILKNTIDIIVNLLENSNYIHREVIEPQNINDQYGNKLFHTYPYPVTSGCCLATLEEIVIGKYHTSESEKVTSTKFLLFNTLNDEKIKLRAFGENNFIGRYPISCAYKKSLWIVGYKVSNDSGANIVSGIPVDSIYNITHENKDTPYEEKKLSSLEDLISSAKNTTKNLW